MVTVVVISAVAIAVALVGCVLIWGFDARRADEIEHDLEVRREGRRGP